ncbi:iron dicitrate transport regulator FecR [Paracoccus sp. YIM 132242]|uniref:Iron dicitrate transport regulator FecR n=1 Tax=Paracoccus lichenicola TaxID=2665644 RepID=A0A6L6HRX8_9RHOB|nr:FecR family protein [Paracoccus lichenicola]MTE01092.1 iron dicitrate transport regulator FecR [Paracoccus lichenicola]
MAHRWFVPGVAMPLSRRLVLAAAAAAMLSRQARAAGRIGHAVRTAGAPSLQRAQGLYPLRARDAVFEGDTVRTDPRSLAELMLGRATRISLGPNSQLVIDRFTADLGGQVSLGGAMVFDRPEDLPPIDLTVRSAFARIGVRGTRFFAGPSNGVFAVFVARGSVEVRTNNQVGGFTLLGPGEGVDIAAGRTGPVVRWGQARVDAAFASVGL